ncbi:mechanosensitive ion channel protein MscS [Pontibacter sp. KCTC 32443]|uniref:mechanosensitive ion channel protein MscS n=1 Tax=Pontibacter TaxID=323449 RepID=UPI00164E6EAE|nr:MULTISPECIES: mechanosensitive ion channel protein MscS [Pontibacter]MBC5775140.1 mechanosensitive ion channel protein MscS [Pontibacter sp. KCTC 32443]
MIIKNIFYAILLGVGMAACLSQNDKSGEGETAGTTPEQSATEITEQNITPTAEQLQIAPDRVGFITIGQNIEQMRQAIPAGFTITDTTLQQEGMQATAYIIKPDQQTKGILVEQQCKQDCNVWRLNVQSDLYKTAKGVHVGSTYSEVQNIHPISTVTLADGGLVAVAKDGGMTFVLETAQIPANQRARLTPATVPANTPVKAILVY